MTSATVAEIAEAPGSAPRRRLSSEDVLPEDRDNPLVQYMLSMTPEQEEAMAMLAEAAHQYGEDEDRALEDIKAGRHPLQAGGRSADGWGEHEAELAAIRAKLGR